MASSSSQPAASDGVTTRSRSRLQAASGGDDDAVQQPAGRTQAYSGSQWKPQDLLSLRVVVGLLERGHPSLAVFSVWLPVAPMV